MTATNSRVTFLPQGALISSFIVGDQNIVQTFPSAAHFASLNKPYFSETIGRVSNRIAHATLRNLNERDYPLHANNGTNCLHGGKEGWGKRQWSGPKDTERNGQKSQLFTYTSPDGEEGFPGTVEARVWYTVHNNNNNNNNNNTLSGKGKDSIQLDAEYEVELIGDEVLETVAAVTNHAYFNPSAKATLDGVIADFASTDHLPVVDDSSQIPTGAIAPFPGLPEGPDKDVTLGVTDPSVDHCMVVDRDASSVPLDTRQRPLKRLVTLKAPDTGIQLEVSSTEPAFQFYTGEGIDVPATEGPAPSGLAAGDQHGLRGEARVKRAGVAIEPSRYVDCVNRPEWRGMVLLRKGSVYGSRSRYVAWRAQ